MKLSSRRKWFGLVTLLCLAVGLLISPVRNKMLRVVANNAINSEIDFDTVRFHRKSQTLEVRDFRTSVCDGSTRVQLCSTNAYIKADLPTLLDKRLIAPNVMLDDCKIMLGPERTVSKPAITTADVAAGMFQPWQTRMEILLSAIEWQKIREECQSLVAADDFANELDSKMRRWLLRSQQILVHAGQLSQTVQSVNNPLRHANEIRQHLRLLEELASEQTGLEKQLMALDGTITDKLSELKSLGQQDATAVAQKIKLQASDLATDVANKAVTDWALCIATQHFEYAQATRAMLPMPKMLSKPFCLNIRNLEKNASIVSMPKMQVNGKLCSPLNETRFQAIGSYAQVQGLDYCPHGTADWTIDCSSPITASMIHLFNGQQSPKWQMESSAESAMGANKSIVAVQPQTEEKMTEPDALATVQQLNASPSASQTEVLAREAQAIPARVPLFTMRADLIDSNWSGTVKINLSGSSDLKRLPCSINADIASSDVPDESSTTSDAMWVEMQLSNDSGVAKLTLSEPLPADFVTKISAPIRAKIDAKRQSTEATLASELEGKCDQLSGRLKTSLAEGKQTLAKHRELLASVRTELKERIETDQNFEYARAYLRESISR